MKVSNAEIVISLREYVVALRANHKRVSAEAYAIKKKMTEVESQVNELLSDPNVKAEVNEVERVLGEWK